MKQFDCKHSAFLSVFEEIKEDLGPEIAKNVLDIIVMRLGGMRMFIPDLQDLYRMDRNQRICNEFTGFNHEELAIKYRIKSRHVRKILGAQK